MSTVLLCLDAQILTSRTSVVAAESCMEPWRLVELTAGVATCASITIPQRIVGQYDIMNGWKSIASNGTEMVR